MSILTVYQENKPEEILLTTSDSGRIAEVLNEAGVLFERWPAEGEIADDADQEAILNVYRNSVDRLMNESGFQTVDVVHMKPDHPEKAAFRAKFLEEHTHSEDEVRFFVEGRGLFTLHIKDQVFSVLCEKGDLISVPAGTPHWFDMGTHPEFTAIRFFNNPEGWVAKWTENDIAQSFPRLLTTDVTTILTDIEGTTSSISFVKDVLFPYASEKMASFVAEHRENPEIAAILQETRDEMGQADASDEDVVARLRGWIEEDRKVTPLKAIQGHIWRRGYEQGDFKSHVYPDAREYLYRWREGGFNMAVYSSGSVQAQHLFFGYSDQGDLRPLFDAWFDTTTGSKKEVDSYRAIAAELEKPASQILFLSDVVSELDAAAQAGMKTCLLVRDGGPCESKDHPVARDFSEVAF